MRNLIVLITVLAIVLVGSAGIANAAGTWNGSTVSTSTTADVELNPSYGGLGDVIGASYNWGYLNISSAYFRPLVLNGGNGYGQNGPVGIGTQTPGEKLEIIGNVKTPAESYIGPSNTAGVYFKSGNVGIGTTTPESKLVVGNGSMTILDGSLYMHPTAGGTSDIIGASYAYGVLTIESPYNRAIVLNGSGGYGRQGNVGIGMYPTVKLDVAGDVKVDGVSVTGMSNAITTIQTLLAYVVGDPAVVEVVEGNAGAIGDLRVAIGANDADISALQSELNGTDGDLDPSRVDAIEATINSITIGNQKLRDDINALTAENTGIISQHTAAIAANLSYITHIEEALNQPGASGVAKYRSVTIPATK